MEIVLVGEQIQIHKEIERILESSGYKCAVFEVATVKEKETWKIFVLKVTMTMEKHPSHTERLIDRERVALSRAYFSIEEFKQFLQLLDRVYVGKLKLDEKSKVFVVSEDDKLSIGGIKLDVVGNFPTDKIEFHGSNSSKDLYGIDYPVYHVPYAIHSSILPQTLTEDFGLESESPPFENLYDAVNHHFNLGLVNVSSWVGFIFPVYQAKIEICKIEPDGIHVDLKYNPSLVSLQALKLSVIAKTNGKVFRGKYDVKDTSIDIHTGFTPTRVEVFLFKDNLKFDEYSEIGEGFRKRRVELLRPTQVGLERLAPSEVSFEYDIFICHAGEDKNEVARPLAEALIAKGLKVWYDEFELRLGDSLRRKIDDGLATSRYGVVILSESFFGKEWTRKELDGLVAREDGKHKVILPIWHGVNKEYVVRYSPTLADKVAASTSEGLDRVVDKILATVMQQTIDARKYMPTKDYLSGVREKARSLREKRIEKISNNETPVPFYGKAKIALHLIPAISLDSDRKYDLQNMLSHLRKMSPIYCSGWNHTFNFDGFLTYSGGREEKSHSYVQIYREGIIEAVEGLLLEPHNEELLIPSIAYEKELIESLNTYMSVLKTLGVKPPILVFLSLIGVKGYRMAVDRFLFPPFERKGIDRDVLLIPEEVVYGYDVDPAQVLKPCFDLIWNACGFQGSLNYNEEGKWSPRRSY